MNRIAVACTVVLATSLVTVSHSASACPVGKSSTSAHRSVPRSMSGGNGGTDTVTLNAPATASQEASSKQMARTRLAVENSDVAAKPAREHRVPLARSGGSSAAATVRLAPSEVESKK